MAMVVHPRNECEKAFTEGLYEALKKRGFSKVGYAKQNLCLENLPLRVTQDDLLIIAEDSYQKSLLFEIYRKTLHDTKHARNLPQITYIDSLTIALSKLVKSIV